MSEMTKKSSYYVLFLGAKESKGLRGQNYVEPVLQYMMSQEHRGMQALKVTLQVSSKGLKIIPCNQRYVTAETQSEKHFIPHHAITCVIQAPPPNDDIVSCILLIYNPDTKCPVHVHCYRCDSPETASILKQQLETLVNREDNQRKFQDIETRLQSKGLLPNSQCHSSTKLDRGTPEFDCRTSDSSENSDRGFGSGSGSNSSNLTSDRHHIATLYDSLAAELREKLSARKTPILLPPKDYDTMHRQRGNFSAMDSRRCSNPAVVGSSGLHRNRNSYTSREQESCGGRSSGIGSAEDNCSPIHETLRQNSQALQASSSDDEDWNPSHLIATESSQFLVRPTWPTNSPPPRSSSSPIPPPLPQRPELRRQRSPDTAPPPLPIFSRERFEGVRQKWEKVDSQYVRQKSEKQSHDSLDEGVFPSFIPSREVAEADYRRQLSRESLLRSLSRSKTGSRDSLDRWVENGVRSPRTTWKEDAAAAVTPADIGCPSSSSNMIKNSANINSNSRGEASHNHHMFTTSSSSLNKPQQHHQQQLKKSHSQDHHHNHHNNNVSTSGGSNSRDNHNSNSRELSKQQQALNKNAHHHSSTSSPCNGGIRGSNGNSNSNNNNNHHHMEPNLSKNQRSRGGGDNCNNTKMYRELADTERFPGLDKDTARVTLHSSIENFNLGSQHHIYSEPSFETSHPPLPTSSKDHKSKRFSFAFWK